MAFPFRFPSRQRGAGLLLLLSLALALLSPGPRVAAQEPQERKRDAMAHINIETIPLLTEALPWTDTEEGVKTLYPFALSMTKTVPAGSIIRIFYVRPVPTEAPVRIMGTDEQRKQAYTRETGVPSDQKAVYGSPEVEGAIKSAQRIVWPNIASFRASLDLINLIDLRIVYMVPGDKEISDDRLAMTEGMLLAEKEGFVTILAVVKGSGAQNAGLRAGDRILAFNGKVLSGESATMATLFTEYRKSAELKIGEQKPYRFRIQRAEAPAPLEITLRPPPSLTGSLIDQ